MIVVGIFVVSTGLFALWWFNRGDDSEQVALTPTEQLEVAIEQGQEKVEVAPEPEPEPEFRLSDFQELADSALIMDGDLYDLRTGELVEEDWIELGKINTLKYEKDRGTILAGRENGLTRYNHQGEKIAEWLHTSPVVYLPDTQRIVFVRDGDLWIGHLNMESLEVDERQVTSIGKLSEKPFASNVVIITDQVALFRDRNNALKVNLKTGDITSIQMPFISRDGQRSPDQSIILASRSQNLQHFNVNEEKFTFVPLGGHYHLNDYHWLDDNTCLVIVAGRALAKYNAQTNEIKLICKYPSYADEFGYISPGQDYIFTAGKQQLMLVDLNQGKVEIIPPGHGITWLDDERFFYSRNVADTAYRGTWLRHVNGEEKQIYPEPYAVSQDGESVKLMNEGQLAAVITEKGIVTFEPETGTIEAITELPSRPKEIVVLE